MKKRILALGLIGLAMGAVFAGCRHHRSMEDKANWVTNRVSSKLDLDDKQEQTLDRIKTELVAKYKSQAAERARLGTDIEALVRSAQIDKAKVKELQTRHQALHSEMEGLLAEKIVEFHAVLKPEQRNKAADIFRDFREKMMR